MRENYQIVHRLTAAEVTEHGAGLSGGVIEVVDAQGQPTGQVYQTGAAGQAPSPVVTAATAGVPTSLAGTGSIALTQAGHAGGAWHAEPGQSAVTLTGADWTGGGAVSLINHSNEPLPVQLGTGLTGYRNTRGASPVVGADPVVTLLTLAPRERALIEVKDGASVNAVVLGGSEPEAGWQGGTYYRTGEIVRAPSAQGAIGAGDRIIRMSGGKSRASFDATEAGQWSEVPEDPDLTAHVGRSDNPHAVTKAQVGLGNADNTSDAAKPVSTASQTAINSKVDKVTGKQLSTEDYTAAEKAKLAGVASGATANATDAHLRDRTTHTGAQPISTVTGLQTALDAKAATAHTHQVADVAGLGTAATADVGTAAGQVPILDASGRLPAVDGSLLTGVAPTLAGSTSQTVLDEGLDAGAATVDRSSVAGQTILTYPAGSSTFRVPLGVTAVRVLLVGGGGGGGVSRYRGDAAGRPGGGGGAGEFLAVASQVVGPATTVNLTIGAGGAGATDAADTNLGVGGSPGTNTTFGALTARGGGGGGGHYAAIQGGWDVAADTGGSGGGGSNGSSGAAATAVAPGLGNSGGTGVLAGGQTAGGGGGGAGGAGGNGSGITGGAGGAGGASDITGTSLTYAAGGGGSSGGTGTTGVSGAGGANNGGAGGAGTNGRGGGGGGAQEGGSDGLAAGQSPGGRGGDGTVVIRWTTRSRTYLALQSFAGDTAARTGGLLTGEFYRDSATGAVRQVV